MTPTFNPRRRWFTFSLRTLLAAVTALALVAGLVAWRYRDVFFHDFYLR